MHHPTLKLYGVSQHSSIQKPDNTANRKEKPPISGKKTHCMPYSRGKWLCHIFHRIRCMPGRQIWELLTMLSIQCLHHIIIQVTGKHKDMETVIHIGLCPASCFGEMAKSIPSSSRDHEEMHGGVQSALLSLQIIKKQFLLTYQSCL